MSATDRFRPVYGVKEQRWSLLDLLERFADPGFFSGGVLRISDLHLRPGKPAHYRFDGELIPLPGGADLDDDTVQALIKPALRDDTLERVQQGEDVDASWEWPEKDLSFRINVFRAREGTCVALRVLARKVPPPEEIGFPFDSTWKEFMAMDQGLVIVTGITGSGKSTTVSSLLTRRAKERGERVITLEDPIEYILEGDKALVSQRELGQHLASFSGGLRSALREDPDVIFVGEVRDPETAALALTAAETGHAVITTLHTKDARGAITRLVDLFPGERSSEICSQLSFSLSMVIAQKLVPRKDGQGRRAAMEVMVNHPSLSHLIRSGKWAQITSQMETQRRQGSITMDRHLKELVDSDEITQETAQRYAHTATFEGL